MDVEAKLWALFVGLPLLVLMLGPMLAGGRKPAPAPRTRPPPPPPPRDQGEVVAGEWLAIDGDTIRPPKGKSIRLMGFDAPEIGQAMHPRERAMGEAARARMQELLDGGQVRLEVQERLDKYGRTLARMFVGGRPASEIMIEEGHARPNNGEARKPW